MAKQKKIPVDVAEKMIATPKYWLQNAGLSWVQTTAKKFPSAYKFRAGLEVETGGGRIEPEGLFIDCYFKKSIINGVPDTLSISLLAKNARVFGIDENGPSGHLSSVGFGHPYYRKKSPTLTSTYLSMSHVTDMRNHFPRTLSKAYGIYS